MSALKINLRYCKNLTLLFKEVEFVDLIGLTFTKIPCLILKKTLLRFYNQ